MVFGRPQSHTLYREFYSRDYVAHNFSWANLFNVFVLIITFLLPFLLTFSAGTFWSKQDIYQE